MMVSKSLMFVTLARHFLEILLDDHYQATLIAKRMFGVLCEERYRRNTIS